MMVLLGAGGTFKKWKLVEGREVTIGIPLKGILAFWPTFFLSLFPPPFPPSLCHAFPCMSTFLQDQHSRAQELWTEKKM